MSGCSDLYNRQLHQLEIDAIRKKAKQLADAGVTSYDDALERLSSQALRDVDGQYASTHPGADVQAQAWLDQVQAQNPAGFDHMPLFQATRTDYNDPTKYAGTKLVDPDVYAAANRPPIRGTLSPTSPSLSAIGTGNLKGLGNFASDLFNRALDLSVGDAGEVAQILGLKDPGTSAQLPKSTLTPDENAAAQATGIMALPFGVEDIGGLFNSKAGSTTVADAGAAQSATNSLGTPDALLPDADFAGRGAVRPDLSSHLVDASISGKQISGGHDMNNFTSALNDAGGTVVSKTEMAPGIYEMKYQLPNANKPATKTVFDPSVYPNMADMASTAASKGLVQYQLNGLASQTVVVDGLEFSVPVRMQNGQPYVPTAFPIGVAR